MLQVCTQPAHIHLQPAQEHRAEKSYIYISHAFFVTARFDCLIPHPGATDLSVVVKCSQEWFVLPMRACSNNSYIHTFIFLLALLVLVVTGCEVKSSFQLSFSGSWPQIPGPHEGSQDVICQELLYYLSSRSCVWPMVSVQWNMLYKEHYLVLSIWRTQTLLYLIIITFTFIHSCPYPEWL